MISDVAGETGQKIIRAIPAGERDGRVLTEVGADLSRFKSAKHFGSWPGLCPGTKISGGKVLSGAAKRAEQLGFQLVPVPKAA